MPELRKVRIGALGRVVTGATPRTGDESAWGDHIDFITPTEMDYSRRNPDGCRRLSSDGAQALRSRMVPAGSVLFACIGFSTGKVSLSRAPAITNQQVNTLIPDRSVVDPDFAYYLLRHWAPSIRHIASGSTTPIVNKSTFESFEVLIPDLLAQASIARTLSALDDKIAVNEQIARTADCLRSAQMDWWARGVDADSLPLSSLAAFVNGRNFTKDASGSGRMVVRIAELSNGPGSSTVYNDINVPDQHVASPGDVLFSWSGTLRVARWYRPDAVINQHIFKVVPNEGVPGWMVHDLIETHLPIFRLIAADKATTMGHIQRRHLDLLVKVPCRVRWDVLDQSLRPLWTRALRAERESLVLAELRDVLLPKLISGELRVKDAERLVSDAV